MPPSYTRILHKSAHSPALTYTDGRLVAGSRALHVVDSQGRDTDVIRIFRRGEVVGQRPITFHVKH